MATIESVIRGKTNSFDVDFFAKAVTANGAPNKLYAAYKDLKKNIGKKVEVTGEFRENRYFSSQKETVVGTNVLSGRFVKTVQGKDDMSKFEFEGFVVKELSEKTRQNGEVYQYTFSLGQEGYKENSLNVIMFNIETSPESNGIVSYVRENYLTGSSVFICGELDFHSETSTVEVNQVGGFGGPIVREYTNKYRNYYVTQGSAPIQPEEEKAYYNNEKIAAMVEAYKAYDVELEKAAKDKAAGTSTEKTTPVAPAQKKRTGSLI